MMTLPPAVTAFLAAVVLLLIALGLSVWLVQRRKGMPPVSLGLRDVIYRS